MSKPKRSLILELDDRLTNARLNYYRFARDSERFKQACSDDDLDVLCAGFVRKTLHVPAGLLRPLGLPRTIKVTAAKRLPKDQSGWIGPFMPAGHASVRLMPDAKEETILPAAQNVLWNYLENPNRPFTKVKFWVKIEEVKST